MRVTTTSLQKLALAPFLAGLFFLSQPTLARAGCGCDKPPPAPAAVIPNAAFPSMSVTLFNKSFKVRQTWNVSFQSGSTTTTVTASVVSKRNLTDPSGTTYTPQLVVSVPNIPMGPTSIQAYTKTASLFVPKESFTVIGMPVVVSEQNATYAVSNYTTAVGSDGTLYITLGGLNNVCQAMNFKSYLKNYPLRVDNVVIPNFQGFLIDSLTTESGYLALTPQQGATSDILYYYRHSFQQYCLEHQPGGSKAVDSADPNWHLSGTPHTDYSVLIFAIGGHFDDGSVPQAGSVTFDLRLDTKVATNGSAWWTPETKEEK